MFTYSLLDQQKKDLDKLVIFIQKQELKYLK